MTTAQTSKTNNAVFIGVGLGVGVVLSVLVIMAIFMIRNRRSTHQSISSFGIRTAIFDSARATLSKGYGHGIANAKAFDFSFEQLQLPCKRVQLGREIERTGDSSVYQSVLLPEKRSIAVRCHESSNIDSQSAVLREAMVLHLFRHDNILALLHVCRFSGVLFFPSFFFCI
jgi:hypothetical protein